MRKIRKNLICLLLLALIVTGITGISVDVSAATVAAPKITSMKSVSYNTLQMKWTKVRGAKGYVIYSATSSKGPFKKAATVKSVDNATITKLVTGRSYYFKMKAYTTSGSKNIYSDYSKTVKATPVPAAPKNVKTAMAADNSAAKISWSKTAGAAGYYIYRSEIGVSSYKRIATVKGYTATEYTDKTVVGNKSYSYKIVAYRMYGTKQIKGLTSSAASLKTPNVFVVSPDSLPYNGKYTNMPSIYNPKTKTYYMLRSYLELFADNGGGELILKAGEYAITSTLYVPSNVTLRFSDGVYLRSIGDKDRTGLFVLDDYRDRKAGKKYTGYNGIHDVKFIGTGNVVFDKEFKTNAGLLIVHAKNVLIDGITFKNMYGDKSHFIEMDATQNGEIRNCTFMDYKGTTAPKEAINLDIPDVITGGVSWKGSSMDKTPNDNIYIHHNTFKNLPAAVGSHMYTPGSAHNNVRIEYNRIENCKYFGLRMQNWKNPSILHNTFVNINSNTAKNNALAIEARGVENPKVYGNIASNVDQFMVIKVNKYSASAIAGKPGLADYATLYNTVNKEDVIHNKVSGTTAPFEIYYSNREDFKDKQYWTAVGF